RRGEEAGRHRRPRQGDLGRAYLAGVDGPAAADDSVLTRWEGGAVARKLVALLRGINVGRAKRVAMADLRDLVEDLGYGEVRTLPNSATVVSPARRAAPATTAARIEKALATGLGVTARVTVLDADDLSAAVAENPLGEVAADPSRLLVAFFRDAADRP